MKSIKTFSTPSDNNFQDKIRIKKSISDNIKIENNINQRLSMEFKKNNILSNNNIFSPNYVSMRKLGKRKKGLLRRISPELDLILRNFRLNSLSSSLKSKCKNII